MSGYVVGQIQQITNADSFGAYQAAAIPTLAKYGGKLVLNGAEIDAGDGGWNPAGIVAVEFESIGQAHEFYNSSEYQAVIRMQFDSADSITEFIDVH